MVLATSRRIRRYHLGTGKVNGKKFPRDHFAQAGARRSSCLGASAGKRVFQGVMLLLNGYVGVVFRHPTKKRTAGRMCWAVVRF